MIGRRFMLVERLSTLIYDIVKFCPEFQTMFLSFIKFAFFSQCFDVLNEVIRLFYYLKHWCRGGITYFISMDFEQEERYIIICMIIQPFYSTSMFVSCICHDPYNNTCIQTQKHM